MGQSDLSDRGEADQRVLSEVGNGAKVCVQQTPRDLQ